MIRIRPDPDPVPDPKHWELLQQGFNTSTPVVTDYKNRPKLHYNSNPLVKLAPKRIGQVILTLFKLPVNFVQ